MTSLRRIVPKWKCLLVELKQTLKEQEERGLDEDKGDEDVTVYLDATPIMQYHYSCGQNFLQCLTTFSDSGVVGFQWGDTMSTHTMEVWTENFKGHFSHTLSLPMESGFRVEHLISVPSHRVFVGACNDLLLRMFSHPNQGMAVQYSVSCPGSVFCMHYCRETGQLLTGGMGVITFWGFWINAQIPLGLLRVIDWSSSSLDRDSTVSALLTESQTLYAICDRRIKSFNLTGSQEYGKFRGRGQSRLRCMCPDWVLRYIYTGDIMGFVQVWSRDTRCLLQEFRAHTRSVSTLLLRPTTHTLLTSSPDGWLKEWSSSGNLLLKLFLDEPGGVRNLWPLGERDILCQALSSFSVWRLQNLYRPFSEPGCGMQVLRRVEGGRGRAHLLAVSQDSIVRLISPISGELLLISWPLLLLDKALTYAYNPTCKELFVASGTPEVLIMDLSLCPSPAKYLVCTSKNKDQDNSVMCVEALILGGTDLGAADPPSCLVFSGHLNGILQLLSPHRLFCPAIKAHAGAILQMSSLASPRPRLCCYGSDKQLSIWEVVLRDILVEVTPCARVSSSSGVVFFHLFSGLVFGVTPSYSLLVFSIPEGRCQRIKRHPPTTISCLDGCTSLGLVALAGPQGIVEVWETRGTRLVEIRLGTDISQVCFANARGDLLLCIRDCICIIFGQRYLPARFVRQVLLLAPVDDLLEDPTSFFPRPQSCYDMAAMPKLVRMFGKASPDPGQAPVEYYELVGDSELDDSELKNVELATPDTGRKSSIQELLDKDRMRKSQARVLTPLNVPRERPSPWPFALPLDMNLKDESMTEDSGDYDSSVTPMESFHFDFLLQNWPIAPDGYLPNSIIRSWMRGQEPPKPQGPKDILALSRTFPHKDEVPLTEVTAVKATAKAAQLHKPVPPTPSPDSVCAREDDSWDLLKSIAQSPWLIARPDVDLAMVINALLRTMDGTDCTVYNKCTEALLKIHKAFLIPPEVKEILSMILFKHMESGNPLWKRLEALKNLANLDLFQDKDLFKLAEVLLDKVVDLRNAVKDILSRLLHIDTKTALFPRLQLDSGHKLLNQLKRRLTEELDLKPDPAPRPAPPLRIPPLPAPPLLPPPPPPSLSFSEKVSLIQLIAPPVPSSGSLKQAPSDSKVGIPDLPLTHPWPTQRTRPEPQPCKPSPPCDNLPQPLPRKPKTFRKFTPSTLSTLSTSRSPVTEIQEVHEDLSLIKVYRTSKIHGGGKMSHPCKAPSACSLSSSINLRLEPIKGRIDPNWRKSLNKLVSLYGFRSLHESRLGSLGPLASPSVSPYRPRSLPPLQSRSAIQVSLGQRVVRSIQVNTPSGRKPPSRFHHRVPLPWQLNSHTLDPSGESQYGRLEVDWVREPLKLLPRSREEKLRLPPISSKCDPT